MPRRFDDLKDLLAHGADTVIDVRSPAEFAEDHIPGALNLPALDNAERAEIGTIYKQVSAFDARKRGAAMVARNIAAHLQGPLADKPGGWVPLVYCWRGGQRSGSVASFLSQIGWRADTIEGGYRSYRRLIVRSLYDVPVPHRLILLDGDTGTAKTEALHRLDRSGVQTIDLEGLARHRGSLLGGDIEAQPSQKAFESALAVRLAALDPARPVVVEAESTRIGRLILPPTVWEAMTQAPRIVLSAPLDARAHYLARAYRDILTDREMLTRQLEPLRRLRGHGVVDHWLALQSEGRFEDLAGALMADHYDPAYAKSRRIDSREVLAEIALSDLDDASLDGAVAEIARLAGSAEGKT